MKVKDLPVKVKAGPDDGLGEGQFSAYASVFGNVDSYGDIVVKGAFDADLKRWEESGNPIPLLFGHNMSDPDFNIGHVVSAVEDEKGLLVTAQLDLENPKGMQTYRMLKGRRVNQMSFAYDVIDEGTVQDSAGVKANELRELKLFEVSVVTIGANQETEVLAVKSATNALLAKAGRELSAKNETALREVSDQIAAAGAAINNVLASVNGGGGKANDQEKASINGPVKSDEEPPGAKAGEEPSPRSHVKRLAAEATIYALTGAGRGSA